MPHRIVVGTSGWSIPRASSGRCPSQGTHLERYSRTFRAAEINSSFHRPHAVATYARWAASTPLEFRFAVKMQRTITHDQMFGAPGPHSNDSCRNPLVWARNAAPSWSNYRPRTPSTNASSDDSLSFCAEVMKGSSSANRATKPGSLTAPTRCGFASPSRGSRPIRRQCPTPSRPRPGRGSSITGCMAPRGSIGRAMTMIDSMRSGRR